MCLFKFGDAGSKARFDRFDEDQSQSVDGHGEGFTAWPTKWRGIPRAVVFLAVSAEL